MNDLEKISTEIELFISEQLYKRFGQYRRGINFLEPFMESGRLENKGRQFTIALIALYAALFTSCAAVLGWYYIQTRGLEKETAIIASKINSEDETRLNGELKEAENLRNYNKVIKDIYESDHDLYEDTHGLTVDVLEKLTDTDGLDVNLSAIIYASTDNLITLECETPELDVPVQYIKNLRMKFPEAVFEYSGYVVVNEMVKFTVQCRLPEQSEEE